MSIFSPLLTASRYSLILAAFCSAVAKGSTNDLVNSELPSMFSISFVVAPIARSVGTIPRRFCFSLFSVPRESKKFLIASDPARFSISFISVATCSICFVLIFPVARPKAITESLAYFVAVAASNPAFLSMSYAIFVFFSSSCCFCSCSIANWNADFSPPLPGVLPFTLSCSCLIFSRLENI